jgi:hypothetical protein
MRDLDHPVLAGAKTSTCTFKAVEDANAIHIHTEDPTKTVQIGAGLNPKLEGELIDFL